MTQNVLSGLPYMKVCCFPAQCCFFLPPPPPPFNSAFSTLSSVRRWKNRLWLCHFSAWINCCCHWSFALQCLQLSLCNHDVRSSGSTSEIFLFFYFYFLCGFGFTLCWGVASHCFTAGGPRLLLAHLWICCLFLFFFLL